MEMPNKNRILGKITYHRSAQMFLVNFPCSTAALKCPKYNWKCFLITSVYYERVWWNLLYSKSLNFHRIKIQAVCLQVKYWKPKVIFLMKLSKLFVKGQQTQTNSKQLFQKKNILHIKYYGDFWIYAN